MRTILVLDLIPLKLEQPPSDGGRQGRSGNLGYKCVMIHCIKCSCQVDGHTHSAVRWFPLAEALPGVSHMRGMQYQIVLNIALCPKLN